MRQVGGKKDVSPCALDNEKARDTTHVLHNVQEPIVDIGLFGELHLDLIQVGERIFDVKRGLRKKWLSALHHYHSLN